MTATNRFAHCGDPSSGAPDWPVTRGAAVTPSDTVDLTFATRALYVGVTGDVTVDLLEGGTNLLFKAMPPGWHPMRVTRVYLTGTTATYMVACD